MLSGVFTSFSSVPESQLCSVVVLQGLLPHSHRYKLPDNAYTYTGSSMPLQTAAESAPSPFYQWSGFFEGERRRCSATRIKSLQGEWQRAVCSEEVTVTSGTLLSPEGHQRNEMVHPKNLCLKQKYDIQIPDELKHEQWDRSCGA